MFLMDGLVHFLRIYFAAHSEHKVRSPGKELFAGISYSQSYNHWEEDVLKFNKYTLFCFSELVIHH